MNKKYDINEYNKHVKRINQLKIETLNFDELTRTLINNKEIFLISKKYI